VICVYVFLIGTENSRLSQNGGHRPTGSEILATSGNPQGLSRVPACSERAVRWHNAARAAGESEFSTRLMLIDVML